MRLRFPLVALGILAIGLSLSLASIRPTDLPEKEVMERSFHRMEEAEALIKEAAIRQGITLEAEDTEGTYLIGPEISPIVTTMGYPDIKRTTLSPDSAALMARLLTEAGLQEGDVVGIGSSGSFPGYLIATLAAADQMGLEVRVIASLGSSMYGATRPDFSILTLLSLLEQQGFAFTVLAVSPGSGNDEGEGTFEGLVYDETQVLSQRLLQESGYTIINETDLLRNINIRKQLYGKIDCFVNIGGAEANVGKGDAVLSLQPGLLTNAHGNESEGLVFSYLREGVPVIHILQIRQLCAAYGIPLDPHPLPSVPTARLVQWSESNFWIPLCTLLLALAVLVGGRYRQWKEDAHDGKCNDEEACICYGGGQDA